MGRNHKSVGKRLREMSKKRKQEEKRDVRRKKKEQPITTTPPESDQVAIGDAHTKDPE